MLLLVAAKQRLKSVLGIQEVLLVLASAVLALAQMVVVVT
jgi:hypothetical protein